MGEILRSEQLNVGYTDCVVKDVNLSLDAGEIAVLIGPNGAGKTTLLKTLAGTIKPLGGTIIVKGKRLVDISLNKRAQIMASVFTEKTNADYTCEEMVALGRYPYTNGAGSLSKADRTLVKEAMELTGVSELSDKRFLKISDGQRQRVLLSRAICQEPDILLLDEPTSFLDIKYKIEFLRLLKQLSREKGFGVIMSLHEIDMAKQIADKIICIKNSHIDRIGKSDAIFADGYIKSLFDIEQGDVDEKTGLGLLCNTIFR